jgi:very-short-patch-repair endonuclease
MARVDLAYAESKVAVEYDGAAHARQMGHDRRRLNKIVIADWRIIHATSERLRDDFGSLVAEIRAAIQLSSS